MYALAIVRYRVPIDEVDEADREAHRAYLRTLKDKGLLVAAGPFHPHTGGGFLLRVPDDDVAAALDTIREADPFTERGIAQYELLPWQVRTGLEDLDAIP